MDSSNNHIFFFKANTTLSSSYNNDFFFQNILENFEKNNKNFYSKNVEKLIKSICYYIEEVCQNNMYFVISNNCENNSQIPHIKILNKDYEIIEKILEEVKVVMYPYYTLKINKKIKNDNYDFIVIPQFQF